jgi:rhodanese-related sulfurtransferase/thioredoxin-related protein
MKSRLKNISFAIAVVFAVCLARAEELKWFTDLAGAQTQAKTEQKTVLLFFHGSDWCPACKEIEKQVFQSPEFIGYARKALVLVDVDFPEKARQSEELKKSNLALKEKFNVGENFPTLLLLDETGHTVFQEAGYAGGGPAAVLPGLQRHAKAPEPAAAGGFKNLTVGEFARMAADKQNVILDVRTVKEFYAGHIAGAVNLDVMSADFAAKAAALDKSKTYLVHCASGVRSVRACEQLGKLDFPKLYNLTGGFRAWVNAGEPVEK